MHVFYYPVIYDFDLNANEELWDELKNALQEHPLLKESEECDRLLNRPDMAIEGYWWFDPQEWP